MTDLMLALPFAKLERLALEPRMRDIGRRDGEPHMAAGRVGGAGEADR